MLYSFLESEICFVENQSDVDRQKSPTISVMQEFNKEGKALGFIFKLKQNSIWSQYFCDDNQTYSIKSHSDFFRWGEMLILLFMYVGTRFLLIISLDELMLQSILGKNIHRHQPFDYDDALALSMNDPRPVKEQAIQNVLAYWIPRFIVDSFIDLVIHESTRTHTLMYKDMDNIMAPLLTVHLEKQYLMKPKPRDHLGQTSFFPYRHLVEQEHHSEEVHDFIMIPHETHTKEYHDKFEHNFKLALQSCQFIIQERIHRSSKYPDQNLAQKCARKKN